jgi:peptidoglycan hydrolase-like protein with peptidoglycan-binding domain
MNIKKLNRKGFSHIEMAIVVLVVAALGFVGYRVLSNTSHAGTNCKGTNYSQGSSGQCVKDIQTIVGALDNVSVTVDDSFGPMTAQAVKNFQLHRGGAYVDGKVGSQTWGLLCSTPLPKATSAQNAAHVDACGNKFPVGSTPAAKVSVEDTLWNQYSAWTPLKVTQDGDAGYDFGNLSYPGGYAANFEVKACVMPGAENIGPWTILMAAHNTSGKDYGQVNLNQFWKRDGGSDVPKANFDERWRNNVTFNYNQIIPPQTYDIYSTTGSRTIIENNHYMSAKDANVWGQIEINTPNYGPIYHDNTISKKVSDLYNGSACKKY